MNHVENQVQAHQSHGKHQHQEMQQPAQNIHPEYSTSDEHAAHPEMQSHERHGSHAAHVDHTGHEQMFHQRFWVCLALSIPVLLYSPMLQSWLGFSMPAFPGSQWITSILGTVIFIYGGIPFLQMAVPELKNRQPGMMTLISLAISVAFFYSLAALLLPTSDSFFWELVTLIDIMLLGHWLEMRSVRQASGALNELAKLMPDTAERIIEGGDIETVPIGKLRMGDLLLVRPGTSMPADGVIEQGSSHLNEALITGESKAVSKQKGDNVIGGTINGEGSLRVRVIATGDDTALAGIMRLVEQAQQSKSRTQLLADKAAGWLFYIALGMAALTAVVWTAAIGFEAEVIARVATVLVIACPHALGLAIPLVVAITTSIGAKNGILARDRLALEKARELDMVIFDKTGTLTKGEFGIVELHSVDGWNNEEVLALTAAIEGDSEHTIARSIRKSAEEHGLELPVVSEFEAIKGRGIRATHNEQVVYVGGPRLLEMLGLELPEELSLFESMSDEKGYSVVHLVIDEHVVASFALADVVRPESREAVNRLHEMGIDVAMLTGDSQAVAATVAEDLGIDQFYAEVLPEHKDQKVAELQKQGRRVAMVGDGVNDAPALTRADVGIAIGSGTDVAVESADIVLVQNNPLDAVKIITLSKASYQKMKENLIWATGYNIVALPLAAGILAPFGILLSPAVGALFMSLSTIIVAINAQLLRRAKLTDI